MLQRIYGTVWQTQADLEQHLWRLEEARKRDHRKLGRDLDLFSFHPESPAAPRSGTPRAWPCAGVRSRSWEVRRDGGFDEVRTPAVVRKELWETSGHWELYQDNMFVLDDSDHQSGAKPMNCPESMLIYKTQLRSYRDLPMRLADYSWLFRRERTGALAGMFRVRQLTQDDSHVLCRDDQVIDEVNLALTLVRRQYAPFGFQPRFKLATRPAKKLGTDEFWDMAEGKLAEALKAADTPYELDPGGGAFYAPRSTSSSTTPLAANGRWRHPGRLPAAATVRPRVPHRGRRLRAAGGHPLRDLRLIRAMDRGHHRALRGRLPSLAGAGPSRGHSHRRPPRRVRQRGPRGAPRGRDPSRGGRARRADAGQGPRRTGATGAGHAGGGGSGRGSACGESGLRTGEQSQGCLSTSS